MNEERCYFDSGCSQHMTERINILTNLQPSREDNVIFGDGARGKIEGMGILIFHGLSRLKDIFLVEILTINMISVSQLCYDGLHVRFNKER